MWPALLLAPHLAAVVLALSDRGIFPDLSALVTSRVPDGVHAERTWLRVDRAHRVLTLYDGADPVMVYPILPPSSPLPTGPLDVAALGLHAVSSTDGDTAHGVGLRADDLAELRRNVLPTGAVVTRAPPRAEDRDGDGIVDRLDILLGAKKLLHNHARYIERYVSIGYPGGDVPRTEGVCSDTVIRALRNAGIDLQKEVHEDILRSPAAYPMVEKVDASINHRRVRTLLPWFVRHFATLPRGERYLPGDIVFFDTFPAREGPDHLGVVSDTVGAHHLPLVINNWTDGAVDAEMDLLSFVPVTHHFRLRPARAD